jgi:hypothetical protein
MRGSVFGANREGNKPNVGPKQQIKYLRECLANPAPPPRIVSPDAMRWAGWLLTAVLVAYLMAHHIPN